MHSIMEYSEVECKRCFIQKPKWRPQLQQRTILPMRNTWRERAKSAMRGKVSQEQLAEILGTSQPGVSHWLNGRSQPDIDDINRIADSIGVSRVWLTHGLGFDQGPGKQLLDVVLSGVLIEADLQALAVTAQALADARAGRPSAIESEAIYGKPPGEKTRNKAVRPVVANSDIPALNKR